MDEKKDGFNLAEVLGNVSNLNTGTPGREQIEYIAIGLLDDDPNNFYALDELEDLTANIELIGLQQPLRVRPNPEKDGRYIIVSGHRRRAAIVPLADKNPAKWGQVACIVEAGALKESDAMKELRLIYANSSTREMTSADKARQAERVEMLLYQLKEEGVEFPGRMRDHVAEACKISASKLARLKVIREGLSDDFKPVYESGKMSEAVAYILARFPTEFQKRLARALKTDAGGVGGFALPSMYTLETLLERYNEGWRWEPCLTCPDGKTCKRGDTFLRHDCDTHINDLCGGKTCCLECSHSKDSYYPCERMCSKAKAARKERKDNAEAKKQAELLRGAKKHRAETQTAAQRLLPLIEAAGLKDATEVKLAKYCYMKLTAGAIKRWASGQFNEDEALHDRELDPDDWSGGDIIKTAKQLGCSTDFLLGLTDEPYPRQVAGMAPGKEKAHASGAKQ